jgi:hypothetical protein|tara:strand:- start:111 stop:362 length:252 start_codon:yes stop_codon:yes gene_type:complete
MADYVSNTGLRPLIITNNGAETNSFIQTPIAYQLKDVTFATEFFNTVTGLFDDTKSTLYFENGLNYSIDQAYSITETELLNLV